MGMMCSRLGERKAGESWAQPLTQIYMEAGGIVLPNRSTFASETGTWTGRWEVGDGGVGVGQAGRMAVAMHPALAPGVYYQELLLQPAPSKESTSFTNHRFY